MTQRWLGSVRVATRDLVVQGNALLTTDTPFAFAGGVLLGAITFVSGRLGFENLSHHPSCPANPFAGLPRINLVSVPVRIAKGFAIQAASGIA